MKISKLIKKSIFVLIHIFLVYGTISPVFAVVFLDKLVYDSNNYDVSWDLVQATSMKFNNNWSKLFVAWTTWTVWEIHEYSLSTNYLITWSNITHVASHTFAEDNSPKGITFNNDWSKIYMIWDQNDNIYEYDLSTSFDISTITYNGNSLNIDNTKSRQWIEFNNSWTKIYFNEYAWDMLYEYNLSTAWDISTATSSYNSNFWDWPTSVRFNSDWSKAFVTEKATNKGIDEYDLSTNYSLSTAIYTWTYNVSLLSTDPQWMDIDNSDSKMFVLDKWWKIYEYTIDTTPPNMTFSSDVEAGPVQSDTIDVNRDDAVIKKWMYDSDWSCSTSAWDYWNDYTVALAENTETNNLDYICFYGEDSLWNITTLASTNDINIDITQATFAWVVSWTYYDAWVTITFSDTNLSWATLNWVIISNWDSISIEDNYILVVEDLAGNSTWAIFTIDWTDPVVTNISSGQYFSGSITPNIVETNYSGATLNWSSYINWTPISNTWTHELVIQDLAGNSTAVTFIIDLTKPTASVQYSPDWPTWTNLNVLATLTWFSETLANANTWNHTFGANWTFTFTFEDLAGNTWDELATVSWIDKTVPTVDTWDIYVWDTGNNWSTLYYNWSINIMASVSDIGWSSLDTSTCKYTTWYWNWISASYDVGWYCYVNWLNPWNDISIGFSIQDIAGNINTWDLKTYTFDDLAPNTSNNANSATGASDLVVTLSPSDAWVWISWTLYCIDTIWTCVPDIVWTSVAVTGDTWVVTHKYVRYYSIDKLWNIETTKTSVQINIDKELPTIIWTSIISSNNSNPSYAKIWDIITYTFTTSESLSWNPTVVLSGWGSMNFVNKAWNTYTYTHQLTATDPEWTIEINVDLTDSVWNNNSENETSSIIFDRTSPSGISITAPINTSYVKWDPDTYIITWSVWNDANFWATPIAIDYSITDFLTTVDIDTATQNDWSYAFQFPSTLNTLWKIRIIATDLAGNQTYITGEEFIFDNTPPTDIDITYPGLYLKGNSWYLINWNWWVDSNPKTIVLSYTTNGTTFTSICSKTNNEQSCTWNTPNINNNNVQLRTVATDEVGMTKSWTTPTFIVDSTKPTAINFLDWNSSRRNYNANSTATSTDGLAGLWSTWMTYKTSWPFTNDCDNYTTSAPIFTDEWYWTGYACIKDNAWNIRTWEQYYKIDKTTPFLDEGIDEIVNAAVNHSASAYDVLSNWVMSDISSILRTKTSWPWNITFSGNNTANTIISADADGDYVLNITIEDNAWNINSGEINFTWDTFVPIITWWSVTNTSTSSPWYSFESNEAWTISYSWLCANGSISSVAVGINTFNYLSRSSATYDNCKLIIKDLAGNETVHNVPIFTVSIPSGGGGWGWYTPTCDLEDLICVNGEYEKKSGVSCKWWYLWDPCNVDICVDWDYSGDPNDWLCEDPTKIEAKTWKVEIIEEDTSTWVWKIYYNSYGEELSDAYSYALNAGITTIDDIEKVNMYGKLIRVHLAKMISEYSTKVLWQKPDTSRVCEFTDMEDQSEEMKYYAKLSCQLWLMGLKTDWTPASVFNPNDVVNRAIFGTTLSRSIWWYEYNGWETWYKKHLEALKNNWIMKIIDVPFNPELRWYVMLMMMRSDQELIESDYTDFESIWGEKVFIPREEIVIENINENINNIVIESDGKFSDTDMDFINNLNQNYSFYEWYLLWANNVWVKYLQYLLKSMDYYTGEIHGINNMQTIEALLEYQIKSGLISSEQDAAAWYLWPETRWKLNPLLQQLINP